MHNLIFGIIAVSVCSLIYFFAWKKHYVKNEHNFALFLLILAGMVLRIYVASDFYLHEWDERFHALVAKNLIQHPFFPTLYDDPVFSFDYKGWASNHVWLHKQPFTLWILAISLKIFGINEIALRIPSILFSSGAIYLTYKISFFLFNNHRVALFAAFFHSIHGLSIELVGGRVATDHVDVLFQFLIELGIWFSILSVIKDRKIFTILVGVVVGLAILTKWLPAGIVILLWLLLQLGHNKLNLSKLGTDLVLLISILALIVLPWQIYILKHYPLEASWEYGYNTRHLFEPLEGHGKSFFYHFNKLRINYGELIYLPLLWFFYYTGKLKDRKAIINALVLITWIIIPYVFFSIVKTKMQAYTLFSAPAIFIISSFFIVRLINSTQKKYLKYLIIALLFLLPVRYAIERIKPFQKRDRNPAWVIKIKNLSKTLENQKDTKIVLLNVPRPVETMFYCKNDVMAYEYIPEKHELIKAKKEGYVIYLVKDTEDSLELTLITP